MICNHSRITSPGNTGTTSSPKTINGDQNGTYLSVNLATDSLSIQRVKLNRVLPPATGEGRDGGDAYCEDTPPIPAFPPPLRGKEPHRHAITVITVEKLSIRCLSKCHSTLSLSVDSRLLRKDAVIAATEICGFEKCASTPLMPCLLQPLQFPRRRSAHYTNR